LSCLPKRQWFQSERLILDNLKVSHGSILAGLLMLSTIGIEAFLPVD